MGEMPINLTCHGHVDVLLQTLTEQLDDMKIVNKNLANDLESTPAMLVEPLLKMTTEVEKKMTSMLNDIRTEHDRSDCAKGIDREAPRCAKGHQMVVDRTGADFCDKCNGGDGIVY